MPTTFANTINGNEILAKRSQCDYTGNDIQTTYATKSDVTTGLSTKEDASNKAQSINTSSTTDFPSSKATADFVNSSVATNTAKFLGNFTLTDLSLTYPATDAQIETALDGYTFSPAPTNNDYVYVEIQDPQTPGVTDVVKRFKYDGSNWLYEYSLNNSSFTAAEIAAIDSGVTSTKVGNYDTHIADTTIHVTSTDKTTWDGKQDAISDLATIRSGAALGATSVQPSDLATVATSGLYSDLSGTPTIPPVLSAGNGIDITNDTVSVDLDGTSLTNGANGLSVTLPVPDTTGASQGDVLSVGQNGIEWATPSGGDDAVLTYNVSTWSDFITAFNAGKNIRVVETISGATYEAVLFEYNPNGSPYGYAKFTATSTKIDSGAVTYRWYKISNIGSGVWTLGAGTLQGTLSGEDAIVVTPSTRKISLTLDGSSLTQSSSGLAVANPLPSTLGTAGQVLQVNSGATGVEWATPSGGSVTDVEVNGTSVVNASGVAEVTVPSGAQLVPAATSADADKVLTVDSQGTPAWATPSAGTVTDVEVDGTSVVSQGVASITMPTVDQTYDGTSTNAQSGTAIAGEIANLAQVPSVTSSDDGKVLTADYTGGVASYSWETPSSTWSGLFEAEYNVTSYADIMQAITNKQIVYCKVPQSGTAVRMAFLAYIGSSTIEFQYYRSVSSKSATNQGDEVYVYTVNSSSNWSTTTRNCYTRITAGTNMSQSYSNGVLTLYASDQLPQSTSSDEGKVLTVDSNGDPEWATPSAGTVTDVEVNGVSVVSGGVADITIPAQVQSDWSEADNTEPSYIQNKPVPKTLLAGTGIVITETANDLTVATTGVAINKTTPELCGSFMGEPMYTKLYEFTGTVGTSDTTVNFTIDEVVATGSTVTRIWLDPSNSFIEYGSASVKLPLTYFLSSARHGSVFVVSQGAGTLSFRGVDTSSVGLTFFLAVKYTDSTP